MTAYAKQTWINGAAGNTPISAARLGHMEDGIFDPASSIAANVFSQGLIPTAVKTTAYTAVAQDYVLLDTTSNTIAVTLPATPANGARIGVKIVLPSPVVNTATYVCSGSDHFNTTSGGTSGTLTLTGQAVILQYSSSNSVWTIQSNDLPLGQLDTRYQATIPSGTFVDVPAATDKVRWVSGTGNDANSGRYAKKAFRTIMAALNDIGASDGTVYVLPGDYTETVNPPYPNTKIYGAGSYNTCNVHAPTSTAGAIVVSQDSVEITNLTCYGTNTAYTGSLVTVNNQKCKLRLLLLDGASTASAINGGNGLVLANEGGVADQVYIRNCSKALTSTANGSSWVFISLKGDSNWQDIVLTGSTVGSNIFLHTKFTNGLCPTASGYVVDISDGGTNVFLNADFDESGTAGGLSMRVGSDHNVFIVGDSSGQTVLQVTGNYNSFDGFRTLNGGAVTGAHNTFRNAQFWYTVFTDSGTANVFERPHLLAGGTLTLGATSLAPLDTVNGVSALALTAPSMTASGKTGATATAVTLAGGTASGAPTTGAHVKGELVLDDTGAGWYCTVSGTPGTWVQIRSSATVVAPHLIIPLAAVTLGSPAVYPLTTFGIFSRFTVPVATAYRYVRSKIGVSSGNYQACVAAITETGGASLGSAFTFSRVMNSGVVACPSSGDFVIDLGSTVLSAGEYILWQWLSDTTATIPNGNSLQSWRLLGGSAQVVGGLAGSGSMSWGDRACGAVLEQA